jgi:hypothetical protein
MPLLPKDKALVLLDKSFKELSRLGPFSDNSEWAMYLRNAAVRTGAIFGDQSTQAREIAQAISATESSHDRTTALKRVLAMLGSFSTEVDDLWLDEGAVGSAMATPRKPSLSEEPPSPVGDHVFVVHGHDHGRMQTIARFLEQVRLKPVILHERPNAGDTVVEKLERHGDAAYAVVLLTPDDVGGVAGDPQALRPRARQNVVLELGYFIARLGRKRTCALVAEGVEIPSDYSGVLYIAFGRTDDWKFHLARELRAAGLAIDMNLVL